MPFIIQKPRLSASSPRRMVPIQLPASLLILRRVKPTPYRSAIIEVVTPTNLTLAVTGASGSIYAVEMLRALAEDARVHKVNLIVSENALRVLAGELHIGGRSQLVEKILGCSCPKVEHHAFQDIGANVASGSYPSDAMIVLPCSMGTLAGIACGIAANLIQRAADVTLKEARPLLLCVRETPLNRIHLRNMQLASDAGATIFPVIPTLYNLPQSTQEMARQFVQRVLAYLGLHQPGAFRWKPDTLPPDAF